MHANITIYIPVTTKLSKYKVQENSSGKIYKSESQTQEEVPKPLAPMIQSLITQNYKLIM